MVLRITQIVHCEVKLSSSWLQISNARMIYEVVFCIAACKLLACGMTCDLWNDPLSCGWGLGTIEWSVCCCVAEAKRFISSLTSLEPLVVNHKMLWLVMYQSTNRYLGLPIAILDCEEKLSSCGLHFADSGTWLACEAKFFALCLWILPTMVVTWEAWDQF